jgi:hypothetical protein
VIGKMMWLNCDALQGQCDAEVTATGVEATTAKLRRAAKALGWTTTRDRNGNDHDFCPDHRGEGVT